jgi:hypothetical protein
VHIPSIAGHSTISSLAHTKRRIDIFLVSLTRIGNLHTIINRWLFKPLSPQILPISPPRYSSSSSNITILFLATASSFHVPCVLIPLPLGYHRWCDTLTSCLLRPSSKSLCNSTTSNSSSCYSPNNCLSANAVSTWHHYQYFTLSLTQIRQIDGHKGAS